MKYRRDIDGLRAVAVIPVVLFHLGVPGFAGGFVGVDVFFVVSGFLITTLLAAEMDHFSLARFYERRVRRIFPALFAMIVATAVAVLVLAFPGDVRAAGKQILAATLFAANLLFFRESGYFDSAAHDKVLLHTWSLSVEEQFYLVFPPLLWALTRVVPRARVAVLGALFVASLAVAVWLVGSNPTAAFYLPHARAWELFAGSLLALRPPPRLGRVAGAVASIAGLAGIFASVFLFTEKTPFPGLLAAPSVVGTVLLLWAGTPSDAAPSTGVVQRVLSLAPVVFVGKLSYSRYLWHWPIIVLARGYLLEDLTLPQAGVVLVASFALAYASYRFVEQPFRAHSGARASARRPLVAAIIVLAASAGVGAALYKTAGFGQATEADAPRGRADYLLGVCLLEIPQRFDAWSAEKCTSHASRAGAPTVALWGDSYAGHLAPGLRSIRDEASFDLVQMTKDACSPLPLAKDLTPECRGFVEGALSWIERERPAVVVLSARWNKYFDQDRIAAETKDVIERVRRSGARVLLVSESPVYSATVPAVRARLRSRGLPTDRFRAKNAFQMEAPLEAAARDAGATLFSPRAELCEGPTCLIAVDDRPLHIDEGHLSTFGSELLARAMRSSLEALLR